MEETFKEGFRPANLTDYYFLSRIGVCERFSEKFVLLWLSSIVVFFSSKTCKSCLLLKYG